MPADAHALLMGEMIKRAVQQEIAREDAQPRMLDAGPAAAPKKPSDRAGLLTLLAGGAADVGSTIYGLKSGHMRENNPLLRGMDPKIGIPLGAAAEIGGVLLARKFLKNHPKALNVAEAALGAGHGALAIKNVLGTRRAAAEASDHGTPPSPNLVWHPDGYWWDPRVFQ